MKKLTLDKIYITSFGKLSRVMAEPCDGLGLMALPNESGKTTYAMFIKFIFYGFSGTRNRSIGENERTLYMPWSGESAEGAIELTYGGDRYRIDRSVNTQGKEKLTVTDLTTRKAAFAGEVPGEVFFGVGEELFSKTLFLKQLTVPTDGDRPLAESLRNIVVSADERDSADAAAGRIAKLQGELTNRQRHGLIHDAEAEAAKYSAEFGEACGISERLSEIDAAIESNNETVSKAVGELDALEKELAHIDSFEAYRTLLKLKACSDEAEEAERQYAEAKEGFDSDAFSEIGGAGVLMSRHADLLAAEAALNNARQRHADAEAQYAAASERVPEGLENISQKDITSHKKLFSVMLALSLLALSGAVACFIAQLIIPACAALAVAVVCAVAATVNRNYASRTAKQCGCRTADELIALLSDMPTLVSDAERAHNELETAFSQMQAAVSNVESAKSTLDMTISRVVGDCGNEEYREQINRMVEVAGNISRLGSIAEAARRTLEVAREGVDIDDLGMKAKSYDGITPERDRKTVEQRKRFYTEQKAQLERKNSENEHERSLLTAKHGDAAVIKGKLDAANARVKQLKRFYMALSVAAEVLKETGEHIKSSVSPRISASASEYFGVLTDKKYTSLVTDTDLAMTFGDGFDTHSCEYLSAGTRECAYIALRLALADAMYPGVSVPLIFDDAFVCIDDIRLPQLMKLLSRLSESRQITVITCSDRESRALDSLGISYSKQELVQC